MAPLVMGACRGLVYPWPPPPPLAPCLWPSLAGAVAMTFYVAGLTVVAKRAGANARWLVPALIAGISLVDAAFILIVLPAQPAFAFARRARLPADALPAALGAGRLNAGFSCGETVASNRCDRIRSCTAVASSGAPTAPASDEISTGPSSSDVGDAAVRAAHQRRVERNHVHQIAEAELSCARASPPPAASAAVSVGIEEQLDRVVAGLAVDVDGARVVGRARVVEPVVVGEPGVAGRDRRPARRCARDRGRRRACSRRRAPARCRAVRASSARHRRRCARHPARTRAPPDDRPRRTPRWRPDRSASVPSSSRTASQPASRSTRLMCTGRSTSDSPYSDSTMTRRPRSRQRVDQPAAHRVDRRARLSRDARVAGAEALQVVVEVRQVDEQQRRRVPRVDRHATRRRSTRST